MFQLRGAILVGGLLGVAGLFAWRMTALPEPVFAQVAPQQAAVPQAAVAAPQDSALPANDAAARSESSGQILSPTTGVLIEILPEGSQVKKGDVIARFDNSNLDELIRQHKLAIEQASAKREAAQRKRDQLKASTEAQVERQRVQRELLGMELEETQGDNSRHALELLELDAKLATLEARIVAAKQRVASTQGLARLDAEADLVELQQTLKVTAARRDWTAGRGAAIARHRAKWAAEEAARELESVQRESRAQLREAEAEVAAHSSTFKLFNDQLQQFQSAIEVNASAMRAPVSGTLRYFRPPGVQNGVELRVGSQVRERQPLFEIVPEE